MPTDVAMRQPIDLASIEPYKIAGKPLGSRHHAAVVAAYPQAEAIWELGRMKRNTKPQSAIEWVLAFVTDAPLTALTEIPQFCSSKFPTPGRSAA